MLEESEAPKLHAGLARAMAKPLYIVVQNTAVFMESAVSMTRDEVVVVP
eukprot:COSAG06_NODE_2823_length_6226_cov_20.189979_6_plen_49_part_00